MLVKFLNLKWEYPDLQQAFLIVFESKNDESRYIAINDELKQTLQKLKSESQSDFVISRNGNRVKSIRTTFENAVKKSGVERFTFHELRHTTHLILLRRVWT
jgi:integrase